MRQEETARDQRAASGAAANLARSKSTPNPWNSEARRCDDDALVIWRQQCVRAIALVHEDTDDPETAHDTVDGARLMLEAIDAEQGKRSGQGSAWCRSIVAFRAKPSTTFGSRADLVRIFEQHVGVDLRRMGTTYRARCPWHNGVSSTSLTIWPDIGGWRCFGCGASGDAFTAWQLVYGCDFPTAARDVARFAGVNLPERRTANRPAARIVARGRRYAS